VYIATLCQSKALTNDSNNEENTGNYNEHETLEMFVQNKNLIYPNPNNGTFQIQVNYPEFEEGTLELFTLQGIKIGTWNVSQNTIIRLDNKLTPNSILIAKLYNATNHIGETKIVIR
jgi:hypothetical protein